MMMFTCFQWMKVTLCGHTWQTTLHSCVYTMHSPQTTQWQQWQLLLQQQQQKQQWRWRQQTTRKQSETADLCQRHVVHQVAAPYSVWQRFPLCPIESNVDKNFKVIQNPGFLPDHPQNWITGSFCHSRQSQKISERSTHNFFSYLANRQTDRQTGKQTKSGKNITSLASVTTTKGQQQRWCNSSYMKISSTTLKRMSDDWQVIGNFVCFVCCFGTILSSGVKNRPILSYNKNH